MTITTKVEKLNPEQLIYSEWLLTHGIGGFACGSLSGVPTRRYHALLNAALPNPYGRTVMLNFIEEILVLPDKTEVALSSVRHLNGNLPPCHLLEYRTENGMPIWT